MFSYDEYDALRTGAGVLDRTGRGRLRLTGADRKSYLQGILTNDIEALQPGRGCYAALLTRQGRMTSDMRISDIGDELLIDLPASTSDAVRKQLEDFIFTEDVTVSDARDTHVQFGLYGPRSAALLERLVTPSGPEGEPISRERLEEMPMDGNVRAAFAGAPVAIVRSDDYGVAGYELFVPAELGAKLLGELQEAGARVVSPAAAEVTRVEAGRPEFGTDMDEETIPLEAGIQDRAISMTKGCYVGQEVIIRVLHRGQGRVAKQLVGLMAEAGARPFARGERIQVDGKDVGVVTSAVTSPGIGRSIGLGYVRREHAVPGQALRIGTDDQAIAASIVETPFIQSAPA